MVSGPKTAHVIAKQESVAVCWNKSNSCVIRKNDNALNSDWHLIMNTIQKIESSFNANFVATGTPHVIIMTIYDATIEDEIGIMTTLGFQCNATPNTLKRCLIFDDFIIFMINVKRRTPSLMNRCFPLHIYFIGSDSSCIAPCSTNQNQCRTKHN